MFCPECGKESREGLKYCMFCGNELNEDASKQETNTIPTQTLPSDVGESLPKQDSVQMPQQPYQQDNSQPAFNQPAYSQPNYSQTQQPAKKSNNTLKILLILFGVVALFFILIFFLILLLIPTAPDRQIEDFYGVWKMEDTMANPDNVNGSDIKGELLEGVDDIYMVIDDDNSFTAYEFYKDESINKVVYKISDFDGYIESPYELETSLDDPFYHVDLDENENLLVSLWSDGESYSHYIVYEKSHKDLDEILNMMETSSETELPEETQEFTVETASPDEDIETTDDDVDPLYVKDIETYIMDTFWMSNGYTFENESAEAIGEGYPIEYESSQNDTMFEFSADGFLYVTYFDATGAAYFTETYTWYPDENGYYIYTSPDDVDVNGETKSFYTAFYVYDNWLYQTSMIDTAQVSNIIQYSPIEWLYSGDLQDNLYDFLKETAWRSKGQSFDNTDAEAYIDGYPKVYDLAYWEIVYTFNEDGSVIAEAIDENYEITDTYISEFMEYNNTSEYIYGFERTENIGGVDHEIYSQFFVVGTNLIEVEMMDDEHFVSNFIVFQQMFP